LPVSLSIGDESFQFRASSVLNDPLMEFVTAALWCLDSGYEIPNPDYGVNPPYALPYERGIHFWLEPEWHSLLLLRVKNSDDIQHRFYENHRGGFGVGENEFMTSTRTICGSETAISFASAVHTAVTESLKSDPGAYENPKKNWHRFPYRLLRDLEGMVRNL